MNALKVKNILGITSILSLALSCVMLFILKSESSLYIMSYPFDLIGNGLRKLSLLSTIGNIIALFIYTLICLMPALIYLYKYKRETSKEIDAILIGLSAYLFYITKYILSTVPMIISMIVMFVGIKLINDFRENQYGENVVEGIKKIYEYSKTTVYLSVVSSLLINGMQLFLSSAISEVNMFLNVPFIPLIVAFVGIILCRYFKESKDLYDDNNTII